MTPRRILLLLLLGLFVTAIVFSAAYIKVMYDGEFSLEAIVQAGNYAAQTATTVGYGNWVPVGIAENDPRVLLMKALSIPFMVLSAAFFSAIVGVVANLLAP
jgi:hypothetical protein